MRQHRVIIIKYIIEFFDVYIASTMVIVDIVAVVIAAVTEVIVVENTIKVVLYKTFVCISIIVADTVVRYGYLHWLRMLLCNHLSPPL